MGAIASSTPSPPRFAATSSPEQLQVARQLLAEFPEVYLHTHLAENTDEVAWVQDLFPDHDGYLDVYDRAIHATHILGDRAPLRE
nr:amidohydrolase family protein [Spirulina major]